MPKEAISGDPFSCSVFTLILYWRSFKAPFLFLQFSYYAWITFLMMFAVILKYIVMICSTISVNRHLICGVCFWRWIWPTRHCGQGQEKASWFLCSKKISIALLMWKWMGLFLKKIYLIRCWNYLSALNWIEDLTLPLLLKLRPGK